MNNELIPWTQAEPEDIARIFTQVDRSYLADGLHPNDLGFQLFSSSLIRRI